MLKKKLQHHYILHLLGKFTNLLRISCCSAEVYIQSLSLFLQIPRDMTRKLRGLKHFFVRLFWIWNKKKIAYKIEFKIRVNKHDMRMRVRSSRHIVGSLTHSQTQTQMRKKELSELSERINTEKKEWIQKKK